MTLVELAEKLRPLIEKAMEFLDDNDALEAVTLYPAWSGDGVNYEQDYRVKYNGLLYKVLITHTSQSNWTPANTPSLFARVLIPDPDVIPDWVQPDSTNPYMKGDKVRFEGKVYESVIDNNIWSPAAYPMGWQEVFNI